MGRKSREKKSRNTVAGAHLQQGAWGASAALTQPRSDVFRSLLNASAPPNFDETRSDSWYVDEGKRGQQLLDAGEAGQATQVFEMILTRLGKAPSYGRAVILGRLARSLHAGGRPELAVTQYREALEVASTLTASEGAKGLRGSLQSELGDALRALGQLAEARKAHEAALAIAEELHDLRGQGVDLSHLGALALAEGKPEEAQQRYRAALQLFQQLREPAMAALAWHQLGVVYQQTGQYDEAERHYREAARLHEERGNLAAAAHTWNQLAVLNQQAGNAAAAEAWYRKAIEMAAGAANASEIPANQDRVAAEGDVAASLPFEVTLSEELNADYVFEPDLLLDGRHEHRLSRWPGDGDALNEEVRPVLMPGTRISMDDDGAIRFSAPPREPSLERHPGCIAMRRSRREVSVSGSTAVAWRLIEAMDGDRTAGAIVSRFPQSERLVATRMLGTLAATEVIDVSGRAIGRYLHSATKKGTLPGGGLESDEVLRLATDGGYRAYSEAPRIALSQSVPEHLRSFYNLTRSRRSRRDYMQRTLSRADFDALLYCACGVTGAMRWAGREVKLRAYPSSGALYAVEIYPVVFRVEGLEQAVYHYRAVDNLLEVVTAGIDLTRFTLAALPVEREMLAGAAAMIALVGNFLRHEQKYGEGGYRMMVAEAGHISQNLVLAATALGLSGRPFGGVFDGLLNQDLGLDERQEQFLLAVLIGHAGGTDGR